VVGNVDQPALDAAGGQEGDAEDDVGKLADRGVGQPRLQIIFTQGDDRGDQDGKGDEIGGGDAQVQSGHGVDPEDVKHHPGGGEDPDLDHRHGVQQGTDRSRRDHRRGQPVVQGHDARLGKPQQTEDIEHGHQPGVVTGWKDAGGDIGGEIQGAGQHIDQDHRRQQQSLGGGSQVNDVLTGAGVGFLILMMGDQGVGADADNLVKEIHGEEVVGEGHPDRPEQRQGEAGVEAGLGVFFEAAHIAHGVEDRQHPQEGGDQGEDHRKTIGPQGDTQAGQNLEEGQVQAVAGQNLGDHGDDQAEHGERGGKRHPLAQVGMLAAAHHHQRPEQRRQQGI